MKPSRMEIIFVLTAGILLPALSLRLGSAFIQDIPAETKPPLTTEIQETEGSPQTRIPVLVDGTVTEMEMDAYLVGVVLAEMPASFEPDALKAQAVVARTYAWKRYVEATRHPQAAVCTDSTCCQAYIPVPEYLDGNGCQEDVDKISQAVLATTGQVLTYQGHLAEATYFSCSGGRTEDAAAVWGSEIPYLQAVDSPGEENASVYTKTVYFTSDQFAQALDRTLSGPLKSWLGVVTWSAGGGVATMVVAGKSYTGVQLRKLLKLNSTAFTMKVVDGKIAITTKGKGHRVGMSQYGADAMAVTGADYVQILAHYYPGTAIDKMDGLG